MIHPSIPTYPTYFCKGTGRKMDIQDQYLGIQLCDKHLIYSIEISKYSAVMSEIDIHINLFQYLRK